MTIFEILFEFPSMVAILLDYASMLATRRPVRPVLSRRTASDSWVM
ncbi:hypothetical protein [Azospirillum humicireducens]|nr:hypothetical protein [Azospirillum humicireducens]